MRTKPLELPTFADREDITRADLVFYGVDHSGPSYVAHVFLDQPRATEDTPRDVEHGYAGSFSVFGHGGCYGEEGHCAPEQRYTDAFDRRAPHPLTPQTKAVVATAALAPLLLDKAKTEVTVTVFTGVADVLRFEYVRLLTYEG